MFPFLIVALCLFFLACSCGIYQVFMLVVSFIAIIIGLSVIKAIFIAAISAPNEKIERIKRDIDKQDERRYMPKEMLEKSNVH